MKLSDIGELGLLRELERTRPCHGDRERRGRARGRSRRDAGRCSSRASTSRSTASPGAISASGRRPSTSATSPPAAPCRRRCVVGAALPGDTELADVLELYAGIAETGVAVVGGDTTAADAAVALGDGDRRSERVPGRGGARSGDLLVVTGPLGAAGAAFREGHACPAAAPTRRGPALAGHAHALLDISDGLARRRWPHRRAARAAASSSSSTACPLAPARRRRPRVRRGLRAARRGLGARPARGDRSLRGGRGRDAPPRRLAVRAPRREHFR